MRYARLLTAENRNFSPQPKQAKIDLTVMKVVSQCSLDMALLMMRSPFLRFAMIGLTRGVSVLAYGMLVGKPLFEMKSEWAIIRNNRQFQREDQDFRGFG